MTDLDIRSHWIKWPLTGERWYNTFKANWLAAGRRRDVEVTVSPKGHSIRVYVDGEQWGPVP